MHWKVHRRRKDGKEHRYFSIVESRRVSGQRAVHRTVVHLGKSNDSQRAAWRKTLEVFDEQEQEFATLSLFPDDREIASDVDALQVQTGGDALVQICTKVSPNRINNLPSDDLTQRVFATG